MACVIATSATRKIETSMIGYEGMAGTSLVLDSPISALLVLIQSPGWALRLPREAFLPTLDVPALRQLWMRYAHVVVVQKSHTSLANGAGTVVQRLARWILMWSDRICEPSFHVTHEYIAIVLGVRRAGITQAIHIFEGKYLIKADRNQIAILSRAGLIREAAEFYGAPEDEYNRVMN